MVLRNRDTVLVLSPAKLRLELPIIRQVVLVGVPAAAIIVLGSSANVVLTHLMSAYGDVSIAAFGIVQKIGTIAIQITVGLTQGIMPLLGYCYGAGEFRRMKDGSRVSWLLLAIYAVCCIAVVEVFAGALVNLFISEQATVDKGVEFLRIWFLCAPGMCFTNLFSSIFQAMGKWVRSLALSVIRQIGFFFPVVVFFNAVLGERGLISAPPISDICALVLGIILYRNAVRKFKE